MFIAALQLWEEVNIINQRINGLSLASVYTK